MMKPYNQHQDTRKLPTEPQTSQRVAGTYQKQSTTKFTQEHDHYNSASYRVWL